MKMGVLNLNCWWISLNGCVSSSVPPLVCVMPVECNEAITKIETALAGDIVLNLSKMCLHVCVLCCLCRLVTTVTLFLFVRISPDRSLSNFCSDESP